MTRHVLAVVVLVVVVLLAMAASADEPAGDDASAPPDRVDATEPVGAAPTDRAAIERAVEATRSVESARVELQTVYRGLDRLSDVPAGIDDVRLVQRAAFDRRSQQAQAEADMSELAAVLERADEQVPGDYREPTRVVIDGDTVYTQIGPMAEQVGLLPTTWVERDVQSLADQPIDNETMALLVQPLGMLDLLRLPLDDVRVVGADEVRGRAAQHLAATVDLRTKVGGEAGAPPPFDDPIQARFRSLGITELPVDLWVGDDDRLVRRLAFSLGGSPAAAADGSGRSAGGLTTTFDVYDVGEPIEVAVPQGDDVIDQAELRARVLGN